MSDILQRSKLRGNYRLSTAQASGGISTSDAVAIIQTERPHPIKIGWTTYDVGLFGPATMPTTGYNPGSLYYILPSAQAVNIGNAIVQTWLQTNEPQPTGVGNWVLVAQLGPGATSGGSSGDGSGGGGGGDE